MGAEVGSELSLALLTTIREAVASRTSRVPSSNVCPSSFSPKYEDSISHVHNTRRGSLCLAAIAQLRKPSWCSLKVHTVTVGVR